MSMSKSGWYINTAKISATQTSRVFVPLMSCCVTLQKLSDMPDQIMCDADMPDQIMCDADMPDQTMSDIPQPNNTETLKETIHRKESQPKAENNEVELEPLHPTDKASSNTDISDHTTNIPRTKTRTHGTKTRTPGGGNITQCCLFCNFMWSTLLAIVIVIIVVIRTQPVTPPPKQFHHTSLSIETSSYKDTDAPTNLLWTKDMRNYVGNIKLLNKTYINIPQNGIYLVNCALQLEIPEHHRSVVITLLVQHMPKNSKKVEVFMKKTSNTLNIREQFMIQFSEVYTLKANDTLFLMMNMAKFISTNMESSYLSISSLHLDDP